MFYVGGHGDAPKWTPMTDPVKFFYQMNDKISYTCIFLAFPNDD